MSFQGNSLDDALATTRRCDRRNADRYVMKFVLFVTSGILLALSAARCQAQTKPAVSLDADSVRRSAQDLRAPRRSFAPSAPLTGSASPVRVVFRSYETASIGAEINAKIIYLPQREGDRFVRGERLVEFDCRKVHAEADAARAALKAHRAAYEAQLTLLRYQATGTLTVEQARSEMEKSQADVRGLEAKLASCSIIAPFDGRVVEKTAQLHEIAQPNQPLIKIINESKLELVLMIPSSWLADIGIGMRFTVSVDETGERHEARIVQSTGLIDPVSQSARLLGELVKPAPTVLPGMSGTASFTRKDIAR